MKKILKKFSSVLTWFVMVCLTMAMIFSVVVNSTNLLPSYWTPSAPLDLREPMTPVNWLKLRYAKQDKAACVRALENSGVSVQALPDFTDSNDQRCGISRRVEISSLPTAKIGPLEMDCALALSLVLWDQNIVQKSARANFDQNVIRYDNLGTYNCREMRTSSGASGRMSKHATARAVDISGFTFENGESVTLLKSWNDPKYTDFFKAVHQGACNYFDVTLGPDYNALHANHFHLDLGVWPVCR